jgi:hypothetical protein
MEFSTLIMSTLTPLFPGEVLYSEEKKTKHSFCLKCYLSIEIIKVNYKDIVLKIFVI